MITIPLTKQIKTLLIASSNNPVFTALFSDFIIEEQLLHIPNECFKSQEIIETLIREGSASQT